ncbi:MAG TPA: hypothetical protein PLN69_06875 [bacterium]|nr:hypothetical protein [bacterium]
MSQWDEIHIKQRVEMSISVLNQDFNFGSMIVRKNDNAIYFPMPSSQHSSKALRKGSPIEIIVHADNKDVTFTGEITTIHPGTPPTVQVNRPSEDQLRVTSKDSSYGLKDKVPLTYRILRDPVTPISDIKKGETVSISQNDVVISTIGNLTPDNFIEINYTLPGDQQVALVGKVKDVREVKSGAQVSYESHINYEIIRDNERDKIVKYIFDKQRMLRKRGLY